MELLEKIGWGLIALMAIIPIFAVTANLYGINF